MYSPEIEQPLGLKLDQGSAPTPNPSGVSAAIPSPPPMEFDVAEITLSQPDAQPRTRLLPGGRIEADGITMHQILQLAWDLTTDELVANSPKWWDETKYSIVATISGPCCGS